MIVTLLLASYSFAGINAADYFPLVPGMKRTYTETGANGGVTEDVVGKPIMINGKEAFPVSTMVYGKKVSGTFYSADQGGVYMIASIPAREKDPIAPMPSPIPVFLVPSGDKPQWDFRGSMEPINALFHDPSKIGEVVTIAGETRVGKPRDVLGKKVDTIEIKLDVLVGSPKLGERTQTTAVYGKGIGLIETTSKTRLGKQTAEAKAVLTAIEELKGGG